MYICCRLPSTTREFNPTKTSVSENTIHVKGSIRAVQNKRALHALRTRGALMHQVLVLLHLLMQSDALLLAVDQ